MHVCRQVYVSDREKIDRELDRLEAKWQEYAEESHICQFPTYLRKQSEECMSDDVHDDIANATTEGKNGYSHIYTMMWRNCK